MPANPVARFANRLVLSRVRRSGSLDSPGMGGLTTVGAKSDATRSTPVAIFPTPSGGWFVVGAAGGGPRNPSWAHNVIAHPDRVSIERGGVKRDVTAVRLRGEERAAALREVYAAAPRFSGYQKRTAREIPVFRLTPR